MKIGKSYKFRFTQRMLLFGILAVFLFASLIYLVTEYQETHLSGILNPAHEVKSSDRILIFSPHPDDESLGAGGLIAKAVEKNATVMVVIVTDGSSSHTRTSYIKLATKTNFTNNESLPELRRNETLNAIKNLGLTENDVIFLGYPDVGLKPMFETYWDYNKTYKSINDFNQQNHSPYSFSYEKNVPYAGANVVKNMETIIRDFKPNIIIYPDDGDDHPDHWATSAFVRYSLMELSYTGEQYTYLVHKGSHWPLPEYYLPNEKLNPPSELIDLDTIWTYISLTKDEENKKENAINSYKSQMNINNTFLQSFIRTNDLLAVYPDITIRRDNGDLSKGIIPESSYKDERADASNTILNPVSDLSSAGIVYDDNYLYLFMQTTNDINNTLLKSFHLRFFTSNETKRIDITVKNGVAEYKQEASNSIKPNENPIVETKNNIITVKLPKSIFNGAKKAIMSTEIYDPNTKKQVDIMAWRNFNFPLIQL
jgi:LmbE family N-acetylglucosaminyl deacetylase